MQFWTFYRLFRRWKWIIVSVSMIVGVLIGGLTYLLPRVYVGEAVLFPTQQASNEGVVSGSELEFVRTGRAVTVSTLANLARTRAVWQKAMEKLDNPIPFEIFQQRVGIRPVGDALIRISWQDAAEERAVDVTNAIVDAFVEYYMALSTQDAVQAREVLTAQQDTTKANLEKAKDELRKFRNENKLFDSAEVEQMRTSHQQLLADQRALAASTERARARADALGGLVMGAPTQSESERTVRVNPDLESRRLALNEATQRLADLQAKGYTDVHPRVIALKNTVEGLQQEMTQMAATGEAETKYTPNPTRATMEGELATARAEVSGMMSQRAEVARQVEQMEASMINLPDRSLVLDRLEDECKRAQAAYEQVSLALNEASTNENTSRSKAEIRIVDRPLPPLAPAPRKTAMKGVLGFVATFALGTILAVFLELLDNRIKGPVDVERLTRLRAIGAVPLVEAEGPDAAELSETALAERFRMAGFPEAIRAIRSYLFLLDTDPPMRVIGIMSARANAGKTTIAGNLAESIAQAGESVVLVDGDMRLPTIHEVFGLPNDRGLSSVLLGECTLSEALAETDVPRLRVLTSGPCPEDPPVLLGLPSMREMIAELRKTVGWVIFDTPAGLAHVDGIVASVELDAALMVVAAGEVARGTEDRLLSDLEAVGTEVIGAVVNRVLPQHADTIYHYQQYYARSKAASDAQ